MTVSICMAAYFWMTPTSVASIIAAQPKYIIANSPAGPWHSNAPVQTFKNAGIQYFEYLDGGYEGSLPGSVPNDLTSNLAFIQAAANAGANGVFIDQVSDGIYRTPNYSYLQQITTKAHGLGLKVVFNTGVPNWSDQLMQYCDYIGGSETWNNEELTISQSKWASRVWLMTQGINDAATAANLTNAALNEGIDAHYACGSYTVLPVWLADYVAGLKKNSTVAVSPGSLASSGSSQTALITAGASGKVGIIVAGLWPP